MFDVIVTRVGRNQQFIVREMEGIAGNIKRTIDNQVYRRLVTLPKMLEVPGAAPLRPLLQMSAHVRLQNYG